LEDEWGLQGCTRTEVAGTIAARTVLSVVTFGNIWFWREFGEAFCKPIEYRELRARINLARFFLKSRLLLAYGKIDHQLAARTKYFRK